MYRSMASPPAACGIDNAREPCSLTAVATHDWPGLGVENIMFAISRAR